MSMNSPAATGPRIFSFGNLDAAARRAPANRLASDSLVSLLRREKQYAFRPREIVFREGDSADRVFILTSGVFRFCYFTPGGRRIVARFGFPQEIVGLDFEQTCPYRAEAIKAASVCSVDRARLELLTARSPDLQDDVVAALRRQIATWRQDMLATAHFRPAEARIAALLALVARHQGTSVRDGMRVRLPMTRADIADFLGLSTETVCRGFTKLKDGGLLTALNPSDVRINDAAGFVALAEG